MSKKQYDIKTYWDPENTDFWESTGKKVANRNLFVSTFALLLAFTVWQIWATIAAQLNKVGFDFTDAQLFTLAALPGLTGATLRLFYTFMPSVFGGKNWTLFSTALLLIPSIGLGMALQDTSTSYNTMVLLAATCGLGAANFSSSMANIGGFFPRAKRGTALGINGGIGNLGVSVVQFLGPIVLAAAVFGSLGGNPLTNDKGKEVYLQNVAYIWIIPIIIALVLIALFMNNLPGMKQSVGDMTSILKLKHTWVMTWLYTCCFGSFIGFSAGMMLLASKEFPDVAFAKFAFLGPLIGACVRPIGGWLSDKIGSGTKVTFYDFIFLLVCVIGVIYFINIHNFAGFLTMFIFMFAATGIANGSTFRMIPNIFEPKVASNVTGFSAAIAAYGAFLIPKLFGWSYTNTGSVNAAFYIFIGFYVISIALTWWFYFRKGAEVKC